MSLAFDAELNTKDWELLNELRLLRLKAAFPKLQPCKVQISSLNNDLLVICDRAHWDKLQSQLVDLRMASWSIAAACNLSIFADNHLVYCGMTQLLETQTAIEPTLESTALRLDSSMVTATKDRTAPTAIPTASIATTGEGPSTLPQFVDLMPLAQKSGVPVDRIATEIAQLGGVAGLDRTGAYITTDKDQRAWVKAYLQRLEATFLVPEPGTIQIATQAPSPPKRSRDASPKNGKAPATAVGAIKEPRLRDFFKAQSYTVTIGRFLDAQGWEEDSPLRAEVFEGIAAFPESKMPTSKGSLAERSFYKILSKYPASSRAVTAKSMIKVARETIGNIAKPTELAVAESTEAP